MGSDSEEAQDRVNSRSFRGYSFSEGVDTTKAEPAPKKGFFARFKKEKKPAEPRVPLSQLFRYATALDVFLMIVGSLAAMAHGAILPLFSLIFGELVDAFNLPPEKLYDEITNTAVYFLYAGIGALALTYMQNAFWIHTSERQISRIRAAYVNAILRKHIGWFDKEDTGELTARIAGDTIVIQESLGGDVGKAIQMFATALAGIILGFIKGWKLTLVLLAVTPLLAAGGAFMVTVVASLTTKGQKAYAKAGAVATEVISSIRTVAAFSAEAKEVTRYAARLKEAKKVGIKRGFTTGLGFGITLFILFGTYALALWYGGELVIDGKMTGGDVLATFFSVLIGAFSLGQAGPSAEKVSKGQGAAFKIFDTIDTPSVIDPLSKEGEVPTSLDGTIKLVNVQFHYPTRPDAQIMKGMNLKIKAGKTVALVGPSGAGKSSIVSLVQRFYDPIEGEVLLDGKNIKSLNIKWLRQQIGLVSQEPVLFSGTIADNISYGKEHATQEEIEAAAKAANAHNFISAFPDGYKTQVGEKGAQLSGGQKQRIAIARAIVKNPKILLLDEATSALDTESEKIVQEALDSVKEGRTTIVIAHRLSTIKNADVIAVINDGKVAEKGTHDELIAKDGIYAELVRAQSSGVPEKKRRKTKTSKKKKEEDVAKLLKSISEKTEEEGAKKKDVSLKRLFALNKPEAGYIFVACFAAIFNGAVNPIFAIIFSEMVVVYYKPPDQMRDETRWWALGFVGIGLVPLIFNTIQSSMFAIAGENLTERIRKLTFQAILRNDIAWFDKEEHSTGILTARLASEATLIEGLVGSRLALSVQNFVTIAAGLVIAFVYGWKLTLVILACSPLIVFANAMQMASMKGLGKRGKAATEAANQIATESIGNIRTVASFTNESNVLRKFEAQLDPQTRIGIKKAHISGFLMGLGEFFLFATYTLGFWYGGRLTRDGEMNLEQVLKVFMAIVLSAMAVGQTAGVAPDAAKAKAAAQVIFDLIDHVPAFDSSSDAGDTISEPNGEIELKNVDFAYATRPDAKVMKQLNLTAEPGKVLALVGQSGCGKSSTISLLERFYDVNGGAITFDGKNIKDLNIKWLRKQIGLVGQEPVLFSGTIADNIRYGKEDATDDEVKAAAKAANAHKFIKEFPDGYKTQVGEKGAQLSGGQKQRIAIARAIVRNPKILLLDEATSALDTESEKIVQAALDSVMTGRTTIVVAHRLSTIKNADVIAVIEGGKVVEKGTHDELVALQGAYYNLVQRQTM